MAHHSVVHLERGSAVIVFGRLPASEVSPRTAGTRTCNNWRTRQLQSRRRSRSSSRIEESQVRVEYSNDGVPWHSREPLRRLGRLCGSSRRQRGCADPHTSPPTQPAPSWMDCSPRLVLRSSRCSLAFCGHLSGRVWAGGRNRSCLESSHWSRSRIRWLEPPRWLFCEHVPNAELACCLGKGQTCGSRTGSASASVRENARI